MYKLHFLIFPNNNIDIFVLFILLQLSCSNKSLRKYFCKKSYVVQKRSLVQISGVCMLHFFFLRFYGFKFFSKIKCLFCLIGSDIFGEHYQLSAKNIVRYISALILSLMFLHFLTHFIKILSKYILKRLRDLSKPDDFITYLNFCS